MEKILESVQLRRLFLWVFGLALTVAVLVRWLGIGSNVSAGTFKEALARVLDGYISSSIVTALIGLVVYLGTSEIRKASAQVEVLPAGDIKRRFLETQRKTKTWYFKGGLGRFFTSETLPNTLKNGDSGYRFRAYLIDPFNPRLCQYVATHRGGGETGVRVATEAFATIIEFVRQVHTKRTAVAEAFCGLIDDFAPLRIDLTDEGVFITHDKASAPATFYRRESPFYSSYDQELTTGPNSYLMLDLLKIADELSSHQVFPPCTVDENYASSVLNRVCQSLQKQRSQVEFAILGTDIPAMVKVARNRTSPY